MSRYSFLIPAIKAGIEDPKKHIVDLYNSGKSCNEISEMFQKKHNIAVSSRQIYYHVKSLATIRSRGESKKLAMKTGRMTYKKGKMVNKDSLLLWIKENLDDNSQISFNKLTEYLCPQKK